MGEMQVSSFAGMSVFVSIIKMDENAWQRTVLGIAGVYCSRFGASVLQVVGALLDVEADDTFVNNLILSVRSLIPVESLVEEVEKRNKLKLLNPFLEQLVSEGSKVGGQMLGQTGRLSGWLGCRHGITLEFHSAGLAKKIAGMRWHSEEFPGYGPPASITVQVMHACCGAELE